MSRSKVTSVETCQRHVSITSISSLKQGIQDARLSVGETGKLKIFLQLIVEYDIKTVARAAADLFLPLVFRQKC